MNEIIISIASMQDVPQIADIMKRVDESLKDKNIFVPDDEDFIRRHIDQNGFILIARDHDKIVGFLIARVPGDASYNLGNDIQLPREELKYVIHMESIAVLPEYRGYGIQKRLIEEAGIKASDYSYLMATVYPENKYSLNNFLIAGYEIRMTKLKYGGLKRHILLKKKMSSEE